MGFFDRLFGKKKEAAKSLDMLFDEHVGVGAERQFLFSEKVENSSWNVDLSKGELVFDNGLTCHIHVIGSYSFSSETWLWAWANQHLDIPSAFLSQSLQLKDLGIQENISELTATELDYDIDGIHKLGIISTSMFDCEGYYLANYGQGILLVTIDKIEPSPILSAQEKQLQILSNYPQAISTYEINNHLYALQHYCETKGFSVEVMGNRLAAQLEHCQIHATFDDNNYLIELSTER